MAHTNKLKMARASPRTVLHVVERDERVVDGDNLNIRVGRRRAHDEATDAAKACDNIARIFEGQSYSAVFEGARGFSAAAASWALRRHVG